eukprot:scaffold2088_cov399-Prasinococcus_capsulatus_cf.AAC.17
MRSRSRSEQDVDTHAFDRKARVAPVTLALSGHPITGRVCSTPRQGVLETLAAVCEGTDASLANSPQSMGRVNAWSSLPPDFHPVAYSLRGVWQTQCDLNGVARPTRQ